MYHSHFNKICGLSEQAHLNTCFKHFMYFTQVQAQPLLRLAYCSWLIQQSCRANKRALLCRPLISWTLAS